jgi:hypothetical protein
MNKIFGSLAAATAAAGALSLITLASASPAASQAASLTASSAVTAGTGSTNWAGWVDTMKKTGGPNRFNRVTATFKVPGINCAKSLIGSKRYPGGPYSGAGFWAGLDNGGANKTWLEQAGITALCSGPKAYATYYAWYQMDPNHNVKVLLRGSKGNPATVRVSDSITITVMDTGGLTPSSPKWADPALAGHIYSVSIQDTTRHVGYYSNALHTPSRAPDSSAEVITEGIGTDGPYHKPYATGLADMGTVHYTDVYVSSYATGWIYGMSMKSSPTWTATPWTLGHRNSLGWHVLVHPGPLGGTSPGSSSPFSTYWK